MCELCCWCAEGRLWELAGLVGGDAPTPRGLRPHASFNEIICERRDDPDTRLWLRALERCETDPRRQGDAPTSPFPVTSRPNQSPSRRSGRRFSSLRLPEVKHSSESELFPGDEWYSVMREAKCIQSFSHSASPTSSWASLPRGREPITAVVCLLFFFPFFPPSENDLCGQTSAK